MYGPILSLVRSWAVIWIFFFFNGLCIEWVKRAMVTVCMVVPTAILAQSFPEYVWAHQDKKLGRTEATPLDNSGEVGTLDLQSNSFHPQGEPGSQGFPPDSMILCWRYELWREGVLSYPSFDMAVFMVAQDSGASQLVSYFFPKEIYSCIVESVCL